ncbi:MAG TPA: MMPL family transporter, partial [Streptosporangiaceae bacterium]|nr:MMPL family transporter [Streptosporangiaceae bacterium]
AQNVRTIVNVGVGLALGVLMDTFLVRTLLVPATAVLIGRWNWWPSALSRRRPASAQEGGRETSLPGLTLLLKLALGVMAAGSPIAPRGHA